MSTLLEKAVWTEHDFDQMGWHDASVYGLALLPGSLELLLDIDYILRWVDPVPPSPNYSFWVSPATLAFQGVQDVESEFSFLHIECLTIQGIKRADPKPTPTGGLTDWQWSIELHQGRLGFRAHGFRQFFRRPPLHTDGQAIGLNSRGGLSFAQE